MSGNINDDGPNGAGPSGSSIQGGWDDRDFEPPLPEQGDNDCHACGNQGVLVCPHCGGESKESPPDIEVLADLEHESWSGWMKYLHPKIMKDFEDSNDPESAVALGIFEELPSVQRYMRQMNTPYSELSEKEKESDRNVAREKLKVYRPGDKS